MIGELDYLPEPSGDINASIYYYYATRKHRMVRCARAVARVAHDTEDPSETRSHINLIINFTRAGEAEDQYRLLHVYYSVLAARGLMQGYEKPPRRQCRLRLVDTQRIRELVEKGWNAAEISRFLNLPYKSVHAYIRSRNLLPPNRKCKRVSEEEVREILELYNRGVPKLRIAKQLGRPVSTVYYVIRRHS